MKAKLLLLISTLAFALTILGANTSIAEDETPPPPPPGDAKRDHFRGPPPGVSKEDWEKLQQVRKQVLDSNADLKAEAEALHKEGKALRESGTNTSTDARKAFMEKMKAHEEKVKAAILKADPTLASVIAAIGKARAEHHRPPPPPASSTNQ